eukprot:TRINITY_DN765_c0_g1_i4.p1 TRINITY_DN765_c0_g1~~TRINITY_DN765_c0_g1_i4.p1  ORF type:complete len:201 (+),score=-3.57 TRINITY_DN765_c0_g1_i4:35-637(+)
MYNYMFLFFFFFSSRRRHTRSCLVSWARRCVQETDHILLDLLNDRHLLMIYAPLYQTYQLPDLRFYYWQFHCGQIYFDQSRHFLLFRYYLIIQNSHFSSLVLAQFSFQYHLCENSSANLVLSQQSSNHQFQLFIANYYSLGLQLVYFSQIHHRHLNIQINFVLVCNFFFLSFCLHFHLFQFNLFIQYFLFSLFQLFQMFQ